MSDFGRTSQKKSVIGEASITKKIVSLFRVSHKTGKPKEIVAQAAVKKKPAKKMAKKVAKKKIVKKTAKKSPQKVQKKVVKKVPLKKGKTVTKVKVAKKQQPLKKQTIKKTAKVKAPVKIKKTTNKITTPVKKVEKNAAGSKITSKSPAPSDSPNLRLITGSKPKRSIKTIQVPVVKVSLCGPHSVYFLGQNATIDSDLLASMVRPEEMEIAKTITSPARKQEFIRGRWLYRYVSKRREPLLRDDKQRPVWPEDLRASISHTQGDVFFCSTAAHIYLSIGLDAQLLSKITGSIESRILTSEESVWLDRAEALMGMTRREALGIMFSFKEAFFKCFSHRVNVPISFTDIFVKEVAFDRREIVASFLPGLGLPEEIIGFYNWVHPENNDTSGDADRIVVCVVDDRVPLEMSDIKKTLMEEEDESPSAEL